MAFLTSIIIALFIAYGSIQYLGVGEGNFSLLLFSAVVVSGIYWLLEKFYFLPKRRRLAISVTEEKARKAILKQPWWIDWTAGIFPVLLIVFGIRSFLYEPFKIPSGSMLPTLYIGDFILVNKYHYGLQLPVLHTQITKGKLPQRGDVIVFRFPKNQNLDYIKRVVGLPGDEVSYINKVLSVNGQAYSKVILPNFWNTNTKETQSQFTEKGSEHDGVDHYILNTPGDPSWNINALLPFPMQQNCSYRREGFTCTVPQESYFVLGDNRDRSSDSRYWGFVPRENIVGKAEYIWMNFSHFDRIGEKIQ